MRNPVAVLISDVHYSLQTLEVADAAMRQAIAKANELKVSLIVAGDLHDTKANMRAECVNRMLDTFSLFAAKCIILVGNHDRLNEKSENHALEFLDFPCITDEIDYVLGRRDVVSKPWFTNDVVCNGMSVHLIPYQHDLDVLRAYLKKIDKGSTIIMHQGIEGSHSGDYIQDKTAITHEDVKDFRVVSGHYHRRQTIRTRNKPYTVAADVGNVIRYRATNQLIGTWDYIGNPYSLNFAESTDPEKGFQILYNDGSLEFAPTNLRNHLVFEFDISAIENVANKVKEIDLVWIKIKGPSDALAKLTKSDITVLAGVTQAYRLDLISIETNVVRSEEQPKEDLSQEAIFDELIDSLSNTDNERKERLKALWKEFTTKG